LRISQAVDCVKSEGLLSLNLCRKQPSSTKFDFDTIRMAANNFSDINKLEQGGFGAVNNKYHFFTVKKIL
jgi:hypothetical protein